MLIDITEIVHVIVPVIAFIAGSKYGVKVAADAAAELKKIEADATKVKQAVESDVQKVEQAVESEVKKIEAEVHL